jgi:hypothetical protein
MCDPIGEECRRRRRLDESLARKEASIHSLLNGAPQ